MAIIEKCYFQQTLTGTNSVVAVTGETSGSIVIRNIHLCNISGTALNYNLYFSITGGSAFTTGHLLLRSGELNPYEAFSYDRLVSFYSSGSIGIQSSAGNQLTVTIFGASLT